MEKGILDVVGGVRGNASAPISGMESLFRSMATLNQPKPRTDPLYNLPSEASTPVFEIVQDSDSRSCSTPVRAATPGRTNGSLSARAKTIPSSPASVPMSPRTLDRASPFEGMAQGFISVNSTLVGEKGLLETIPDERVYQNTDVSKPCFRPLQPDEADIRSVDELKRRTTGVERVYQSTIRQEWLDDESSQENTEWNVQRWTPGGSLVSLSTPLPAKQAHAEGHKASTLEAAVSLHAGLFEGPAKTTLGLILDGEVIKGFHPQFDFSTLAVGDRIVQVDGEPIDSVSLPDALRGADIVGSVVTLTLRKSDGSCLDMQLRRWGIAGGKAGGKDMQTVIMRKPPKISQDSLPQASPLVAMSTMLSTPRGLPPASVQAMLNTFGERQVDVINKMVTVIANSSVDNALVKADLLSKFAPLAGDSSLDLDDVFKILDLDSDGYISASDLAHVHFLFGQHENKLEVLFQHYEESDASETFVGLVKKLVLYTTRSLFKLRSIIHGGGMSKPYLETGPSPAMVLKAVDELCSFMRRDSSRTAMLREFLLEAKSMKLTSSSTLKTWLINMSCLSPSTDQNTSLPKEVSDERAAAVTTAAKASPPGQKIGASTPSQKSMTLLTGQKIVIPTSNKMQGLVAAACNQVGVASVKASAVKASLQRSQHMTLEWLLEEDACTAAAASKDDEPALSSSRLVDSVQARLGLKMDGCAVQAVSAGSVSDGKLNVGDVITCVQGRQVVGAKVLSDIAQAAIPGETILFKVRATASGGSSGTAGASCSTERGISLRVPFKSHSQLAADLRHKVRKETNEQHASKARGDRQPQPTSNSAVPNVQSFTDGFLAGLTRVNESILQGSREARQGVAAPKAESPAHLSAATNPTLSDNSHLRLLLDDAENSTENKGRDDIMSPAPAPSISNTTLLRKLVRQIYLQHDSRQVGLLTLSQAATVAALLHQKLLTGVEGSSSTALISAMQDKLRKCLEIQPSQETERIIDFQTLYTWYEGEFQNVADSSSVFRNSLLPPQTSPPSALLSTASTRLPTRSPALSGSDVSDVVTGHPYWGGQRGASDAGMPKKLAL